VQSVFRTFFRRASEGHYQIPHGEELWRLLLVIALNKIRSLGEYHRAGKRDVSRTVSADRLLAANLNDRFHDEPGLLTLRMVLNDLLGELPESARQIIELRIEGHQVAEIAEQARRSKRTVERVLQDFRNQLQRVIDEETSTT
jgi:RNA polymerase sigma-70 factor (ECF subfamily)